MLAGLLGGIGGHQQQMARQDELFDSLLSLARQNTLTITGATTTCSVFNPSLIFASGDALGCLQTTIPKTERQIAEEEFNSWADVELYT